MPRLTCRDVSELTTEYLENALPFPKRVRVRMHLAICDFCRRHLSQVRATVALLRRLPPIRLDPAQEDALIAQMLHDPHHPAGEH